MIMQDNTKGREPKNKSRGNVPMRFNDPETELLRMIKNRSRHNDPQYLLRFRQLTEVLRSVNRKNIKTMYACG